MKKLSLALLFLVIAVWPVWAQPVTVVGPITPGDCALFNSNTILKDAGFACNGSSGPVVFGPATSVVGDVAIWNNTTGNSLKDVAVWGGVAGVGGLTLYASASGSGTQTCLSPANSCTLPTACSAIKKFATFLGVPNIQLADDTYATADITGAQCEVDGNNGGSSGLLTSINGNPVTPGNVVIAIQSGQNGFVIQDGGEASINHLKITNVNGGGAGITGRQNAIVDYRDIQWGTWGNSGSHVAAYGNAVIINPGNETLLAGTSFLIHWNITDRAAVIPGGTTTLQSSVSWSIYFSSVTNGGSLDLGGWTLSGNGTGPQFAGVGIGLLTSGATPCASVFPGTGGCSLSLGFQSSAGDATTSGPLTSQKFVGAPVTPTGNSQMSVGVSSSNGAEIVGQGSISDISLLNKAGSVVCSIPTNSNQFTCGDFVIPFAVMQLGSDAIGDIYYNAGSGVLARLGIGPTGNPLTVVGGLPSWANALGVVGGGTGNATAAAHSIPVSEGTSPQAAVGPCLTNQVIVGGGAGADPACGSNTAGSQQYLCTITASNSASINNAAPTSGACPINGTYTSYLLVFQKIVPATNEKILQLQIHSGGAYKATGYLTNNTIFQSSGLNGSQGATTYIPLTFPADASTSSLANASPGFSGQVILTAPSANDLCWVDVKGVYLSGGTTIVNTLSGGFWNTAAVVDGFQVLMDSGNLTSGSILVYGIL